MYQYADPTRKRRMLYERSVTVGAVSPFDSSSHLHPDCLSASSMPEAPDLRRASRDSRSSRDSEASECRSPSPSPGEHSRLLQLGDSPTHSRTPSPSPSPRGSGIGSGLLHPHQVPLLMDHDRITQIEDDPRWNETSSSSSNTPKPGRTKRARFNAHNVQRSVSVAEPPVSSVLRADIPQGPFPLQKVTKSHENVGRHHHKTASAPGNLLSKVKERIREKVFQSTEWYNAAAMMNEKRQRANHAAESSLASRRNLDLQQIQLHELHKKKSTRSKTECYEIGVVDPDTDTVRQAFIRRRSISEDTYDRQPVVQLKAAGIITSQEEIRPSEHKSFGLRLRKSPRLIKKHMRAQSLDTAKLTRAAIEPQVSVDSSSSGMSSCRTLDSVGSQPELDMNLPELVLDDRTKEAIMEETVEEEEEEEEEDDQKPQPVPEVQFDEFGQTWDVYGADFDPGILGHAIQKHLEKMMIRKVEVERRQSLQQSCASQVSEAAQEGGRHEADREKGGTAEPSFWLRLLCLFNSRGEVAS